MRKVQTFMVYNKFCLAICTHLGVVVGCFQKSPWQKTYHCPMLPWFPLTTNLYLSVPIPEFKNNLYARISPYVPNFFERDELVKIIDVCLDQNYYLFSDTLCRQHLGFQWALQSQVISLTSSRWPIIPYPHVKIASQTI